MAIVGGFDIHRRQVTFDYLDTVSGPVRGGRIDPACRAALRTWLERFAGREDVTFAVEGCTGWRFVVEELQRAGITALLAEPAETARQRGPEKRAKADKTVHQGVPRLAGRLSDPQARALLEHGQDIGLSQAGAQAVAGALWLARKLARRSHHILRRLGDAAYAPLPGG